MWDITIHPLMEPDDLVGTTRHLARLTLIPNVTARPNLANIIGFGPYRHHEFVFRSHAWPQIMSDKSTTNNTNKANYQILTRRCEISQSTLLKEPDDPIGTTEQPVRPTLILNVTTRSNLLNIVRFKPYRSHRFVLGSHA